MPRTPRGGLGSPLPQKSQRNPLVLKRPLLGPLVNRELDTAGGRAKGGLQKFIPGAPLSISFHPPQLRCTNLRCSQLPPRFPEGKTAPQHSPLNSRSLQKKKKGEKKENLTPQDG